MQSGPKLLVLSAISLQLGGCSRTHEANTPTELHDELRIIAAATRVLIADNPSSDSFCVSRRLFSDRLLTDRAISDAMGNVTLGPSCDGYRFLRFRRVQFGHGGANAIADMRSSCSGTIYSFRMRQARGEWHVLEYRPIVTNSDAICPASIPIRREADHFRLIGPRAIRWVPSGITAVPRASPPADSSDS